MQLVLLRTAILLLLSHVGAETLPPLASPLKVTVFSWNVAMCSPSQTDCAFIKKLGESSDIVVIGVQEVEELRISQVQPNLQKSHLIRRRIRSNLKNHRCLSETTHGGTQLLIYATKDLPPPNRINTWEVTCGIGQVVKNKGGLGVSLCLGGHRCAFIMAHLAAHQNKVDARNADFSRILRESEKCLLAEGSSLADVDFLCFGGDLNYRIDLTREEVELCLSPGYPPSSGILAELMEHDQLTKARASLSEFFGFSEAPIAFRPTFKFDKRTDQYDTSAKRRIPAWTDRVLYRCAPGFKAHVISYDAVEDASMSDHRPVCAQFELSGLEHR